MYTQKLIVYECTFKNCLTLTEIQYRGSKTAPEVGINLELSNILLYLSSR